LIRVAAVGDVHVGRDMRPELYSFDRIREGADLLLLAGDLTQHGYADEVRLLCKKLASLDVPIVAVLGNHDYHQGEEAAIRRELESAGVRVLEAEGVVLELSGTRVGVGGVKGFGGGFPGASGSEFGEEEMKAFVRHSRLLGEAFGTALASLEADMRIALTHYSPARGTLSGEPLEIYPFLGSYFLGEAIDRASCVVAFHGHAHSGSERALTPGGVPVRNVARPVIRLAYKVYTLSGEQPLAGPRSTQCASLR
jgi:Icc-related predicted phosphoesterase